MKIAYTGGYILDGSEKMTPIAGHTVLTGGEFITAVLPDGDADLSGYRVIDLKGGYIMPGLINLHVHIPASGKPTKKPSDPKKLVRVMTSCGLMRRLMDKLCEGYARTELLSGVTTLRAVGGVEDCDSRLRDRIASGRAVGPRILAADMAVSVPGGHMAGSLAYEAKTAQEAAAYVRKIAGGKPDLIKLMITGGVLDAVEKGEPGVLKMSPELVHAACDAAHELKLPVAAHVESPEGVKVALRGGVDTIEHGAMPDDEMMRLFRQTGAVHIATLSPALPYAFFDPAVSGCDEMARFNGQVVFDGIVECAKRCLAEGVPVGLGTDTGCPYTTHYDMWRELHYFHKYCGVTNTFALYTATKLNAKLAGLGDRLGGIEAGKCADMIVSRKNPLEDLSALRTLQIVVARGEPIMDPRVKKMPQVESELDKFL